MNKNVIKYILIIAVIVIALSSIIFVYSIASKSDNDINTYDKIKQELSYLDSSIVVIMNSLNNINTEYLITTNKINTESSSSSSSQSSGKSQSTNSSSSNTNQNSQSSNKNTIDVSSVDTNSILSIDRNNIDWNYIQSEMENISSTWSIITIDLKSINVSNDDILAFNNNMDIALNYVKSKDKQNSLISIANVYNLIPKYKESLKEENKDVEISYAKADIISSYALLDISKWDNISSLLNDADNRISGLMNSENSSESENVQKKYVLLKDYIKSTNDKNVDLCYMKYYYLMKEF